MITIIFSIYLRWYNIFHPLVFSRLQKDVIVISSVLSREGIHLLEAKYLIMVMDNMVLVLA